MHIAARWIAPIGGERSLLEGHTLIVRDGRILDVLPNAAAAERYVPRVSLQRPSHLLLPGLVNAYTHLGGPTVDGAASERSAFADRALLGIAQMLKGGTTTFCDVGYSPSEAARAATLQGMRAVVGLPLAQRPSGWANNPAEYLSRALKLRDEYKGHPSVSTAFAPLEVNALDDAALARMGTLAAELDASVLLALNESQRDIEDCVARHGRPPLARLDALGLLTPALTVAHAARLNAAELDVARRADIGVVRCFASSLLRGNGGPPIGALGAGRMGLGSDEAACGTAQDLWSEVKLLALHSAADGGDTSTQAQSALATATRGGAAVLGLDADIGTLEAGKWADLCCLDLSGPATDPSGDPVRQAVFCGGRDLVSDVWIAGRHLLSEGRFTRLDWPGLAARLREAP
jgi:5-methylthioadenosine/S-adenosylhomocysteine deaminase